MDKWVGIVKVNREKESLNFVNKDQDEVNINFFPQKPVNNFQKIIDAKLSKMNLQSQKALLKEEKNILG